MQITTIALEKLAEMPRWVAWQKEERCGRNATKTPYGVGGREAKTDDPSTWLTLAKELAARGPKPFALDTIALELGDLEWVPPAKVTARSEWRFLTVTGIEPHRDGAAGPRATPYQASSGTPAPEVRP